MMNARGHFLGLILVTALISTPVVTKPLMASQDEWNRLREEQRATTETIRTIAIAVESFAVDENRYPGPTDGAVDIRFLKRFLVPQYLKTPDWDDGWNHTLRFRSDESHYVIVSYGSDGIPDHEDWGNGAYDEDRLHREMCGGPIPGTRHDIVFMDGEFCQYPAGLNEQE
jgi:hypothetical protein